MVYNVKGNSNECSCGYSFSYKFGFYISCGFNANYNCSSFQDINELCNKSKFKLILGSIFYKL